MNIYSGDFDRLKDALIEDFRMRGIRQTVNIEWALVAVIKAYANKDDKGHPLPVQVDGQIFDAIWGPLTWIGWAQNAFLLERDHSFMQVELGEKAIKLLDLYLA